MLLDDVKFCDKMIAKYPSYFAHTRRSYIGLPEGWQPIFEELLEKLSTIKATEIAILQVKEKFGTLRVYCQIQGLPELTELASKYIREAEFKASKTCQVCGVPGSWQHSSGMPKVVCTEHNMAV